MWFISILAIVAILWFLYVIAQNTSESLDNQRELLREIKDLRSAFQEAAKSQSASNTEGQALLSSKEATQSANVHSPKESTSNVSTSNASTSSASTSTSNVSTSHPSSSSEENESESSSQININNAELNELQSLPGVGKVVAQKIIDARPFESVESLAEVSGVSSELLNKIKSRVTI